MKPQQFRKKPVVIEAVQWTGGPEAATPIIQWFLDNSDRCARYHEAMMNPDTTETIHIDTLEGVMGAMPGDWIIRGVAGEFYPCKPDIFEATYTAAEEAETCTTFELSPFQKEWISESIQNQFKEWGDPRPGKEISHLAYAGLCDAKKELEELKSKI